jgi:hypothetical protein
VTFRHKITRMRLVAFGESLPSGTRLTLFSDDKPDCFFTVIKFWMDEASGVALATERWRSYLSSRRRPAAPKACRRREEGRIHLLIHLPIKAGEHRWRLWRPDQAGFDSRSVFNDALVKE